ncbi:MAG TPA: helix-hairpin-helix domain-containing protein [Candidatus Eisenbacteria bacterium]|nr:helix-hairpin-helix domain-containing protein [Candidatus Eisenbacteria bacterium]
MAVELNLKVARRFDEVASLLEEQVANPFRVRAYRRAAETLRRLERPVDEILATEGLVGLEAIPGVGESLARAIRDIVKTGRLPMLARLRGASDPEELLRTVPGIGRATADRLHHDLGIGTLEDLEQAAHDGRLALLAGFGPKRVAAIIDTLDSRLGRVRRGSRAPRGGAAPAGAGEPGGAGGAGGRATEPDAPPVGEILDVDREYRERAEAGELRRIAPRRFNPEGEAWLPILHAPRGKRHYTALFSNTARAHELGKTGDWVVLYYDGPGGERQCTVITSDRGLLKGKRIVRGREEECALWYASRSGTS